MLDEVLIGGALEGLLLDDRGAENQDEGVDVAVSYRPKLVLLHVSGDLGPPLFYVPVVSAPASRRGLEVLDAECAQVPEYFLIGRVKA